jgi:hypothetical protein
MSHATTSPVCFQLRSKKADGTWAIFGLHVPTGKKFVFLANVSDFDTATEIAETQAKAMDPFGGQWKWASMWLDIDANLIQHNTAFEDDGSPIPFDLTERGFANAMQSGSSDLDLDIPPLPAELDRPGAEVMANTPY